MVDENRGKSGQQYYNNYIGNKPSNYISQKVRNISKSLQIKGSYTALAIDPHNGSINRLRGQFSMTVIKRAACKQHGTEN